MKITKYFTSSYKPRGNLRTLISEAEAERDQFLSFNQESIEEVESESIQFIGGTSGDSLAVIITLTYYKKGNDT